ncbi:MAG: DNA polymerase III subunit gamma/tau [Melioribacteraceae bacterium]|nr:DNA polymerase III subunit gamma/tau [Melioribacteraceae bacterium]MCF8355651.1 DNA polymerase III subunit gamma/tau [Melioribacteraceae bacterium]MCF8395147.1 DNA polymerase III subunit gamma/tau [Melioribacteraceae bacterium]MCF8420559.1 DNA polymerase III subunit gamma/tau [Melioribacteraceae bacterium]
MNFIVTARKWRPQKFSEVVGQEHISTTLKNAIKNNRIAHAFIFAGPRGVGKTTTARILAKSLNCLNPKDGEPCNECEMCLSFQKSQSLDIIEIDGASNRRIEEVRSLRESVKYAPTKGNYKIYIIDEVHMLTPESFNALLKTLEEPPEHTIFIFATTDVHKVPPTIISRCQRFDFRRIELEAIKGLLKKIAKAESIVIDDKSLTLIAKKADGALRDAQSLFDQVSAFCGNKIESGELSKMLNLIDEEIYFDLTNAIIEKNFKAPFDITQNIYDNGWNFIDFTNGLLEHFRNIMTVIVRGNTDLIESAEMYKVKYLSYEKEFTESDILRILAYLNKVQGDIRTSQNQKLKIEISLCHLVGLEKTETISNIINNIGNINISAPSKSMENISGNSQPAGLKKNAEAAEIKATTQIMEPKIEKFTPPSFETDSDFSSIVDKWQHFVEMVSSERTIKGNLLIHSEPVKIHHDKVEIALKTPEDSTILNKDKDFLDFLETKSKEYFGKKVQYNFSKKANRSERKPYDSKKEETAAPSENRADSPLITSIKNELGGREITR